jgi:hypothetical protein
VEAHVKALLQKWVAAWAASWLFLLWSALCLSVGAAWAFLMIIAALKAQGVL